MHCSSSIVLRILSSEATTDLAGIRRRQEIAKFNQCWHHVGFEVQSAVAHDVFAVIASSDAITIAFTA